MKVVVKLLVAAAIVNAAAHGAMTAWSYYQLKDEAEQLVRFGASQSTGQLHNSILAKAQELELPLAPEDIDVRRDGTRTIATVSYTQPVEFFPRYTYPLKLSFQVEAFSLQPLAR